ncbi:MAG: DUF4412 domain-containing protein [candidate division WOR-3 bacterium]
MRKIIFIICVGLFLCPLILFGGIEWQAQTTTKTKDQESKVIIHGYAQKGMVREEYVDVSDGKNQLTKKGMYWLYYPDKNDIYIVDPEEKAYFVMNVDSIAKLTGALSKFVKFTISNPKIEVKKLDSENILGEDCQHIQMNTSYDMETKIMIMKVKTHTEESKEIWATSMHLEDISLNFSKKSFSSGIADLDSMIRKEMEAYEGVGFILKSITTNKTSDAKGKVTSESVTEMVIEKLETKDLNADLFTVPSDYKQIEFNLKMESED